MASYGNSSSWRRDVSQRYDNGPCGAVMADALGTLYDNWHLPRTDEITGIKAILHRFNIGPLTSI
jgi:hypothetical protein